MKFAANREYALEPVIEEKLREPSLFRFVLHNDDYTPMEFVVKVLEQFFYMDRRTAINIMMEVHTRGKAAFGLFTQDVVETKISQVAEQAKLHEHPLNCSAEAA